MKISQRNEGFRRIKLKEEALGLVASINAHGSYLLGANNVNICLCLLMGEYYEVITLMNHLNFSHSNTYSPLGSSRWSSATLFLTRTALRYLISHC